MLNIVNSIDDKMKDIYKVNFVHPDIKLIETSTLQRLQLSPQKYFFFLFETITKDLNQSPKSYH